VLWGGAFFVQPVLRLALHVPTMMAGRMDDRKVCMVRLCAMGVTSLQSNFRSASAAAHASSASVMQAGAKSNLLVLMVRDQSSCGGTVHYVCEFLFTSVACMTFVALGRLLLFVA
jgi:hypothetical protein